MFWRLLIEVWPVFPLTDPLEDGGKSCKSPATCWKEPEQGTDGGADGLGPGKLSAKRTAKCLLVHSYWVAPFIRQDGAVTQWQWGQPFPEKAERTAVLVGKPVFLKTIPSPQQKVQSLRFYKCHLPAKGKEILRLVFLKDLFKDYSIAPLNSKTTSCIKYAQQQKILTENPVTSPHCKS